MPEVSSLASDSAEVSLAAAALGEIAGSGSVGEFIDAPPESESVTVVRFASAMTGYPDWVWTVLVSRGVEGGPTVLEAALVPGATSLLAPAWVPWADRLADYVAARENDDAEASATDDESVDDSDDDDDLEIVDDDDPFDSADDGPDIDVEAVLIEQGDDDESPTASATT